MRRMVKEDLLTFEGKPLFPERIAETVPYELSVLEQDLYEQVTTYVREGMNRADKLDGKRRNTVGFALTVLQRRLASSPEAIYRSLQRRADRLERRKQETLAGGTLAEPAATSAIDSLEEFDDEEYTAEELEHLEDELVDAATAARTVEELDAELLELRALIEAAAARPSVGHRPQVVRAAHDPRGQHPRHLGGERRAAQAHRLHRASRHARLPRCGGSARCSAGQRRSQAIHGGVRHSERRRITEEFTVNADCQVLLGDRRGR